MPFFVKNHWICIKIDVENYELSYYDPLQRNRDFEMKEICLYIFWNDPFKIIEEKFLKQKNTNDCGVYVCYYIEKKINK